MGWLLNSLFLIGCAELWHRGGSKKAWLRDVLIPVMIGLLLALKTNFWIGFFSIGAFQIIRIGYGIPDPGTDDKGSWLGRVFKIPWLVRGVAGALYGLVGLSIWIWFTKQFGVYLGYALLNFFVNAMGEKMKWPVGVVERLAGAAIGSIVFFI